MITQKGILINNNWTYRIEGTETQVDIPHTTKEVSYNYFDEKSYQLITEYEKNIKVSQNAKRIFLKFDGVMTAFELFMNDKFVRECRGGYIPHIIEITEFVTKGTDNKILIKVDSTEREDIPPFGNVIDYLTFGGIYRDVFYYEMEECFIQNIFYKYEVEDVKTGKVKIMSKLEIDNNLDLTEFDISINIMGKTFERKINIQKGKNQYEIDAISVDNVKLWDIETPDLYDVTAKLSLNNTIYDENKVILGFRKLVVNETGIYLNDKKVKVFGLNRHQSFPYVGYAMPKRAQRRDADILKETLSLNTVRSSHYPPSPHFLQRCDEIGLLVLEEIPGWQFISQNEKWREQVLDDVKAMIERDYNHPSVITWGVRINESGDDEELYTKTNNLARSLDDTRLTSGIRCYEKSQLLEDIYTMNDFIHCGDKHILRPQQQVTGLDHKVPYMITEFCGHIYPTKRFDNEEKLVEHMLRHGRVHSSAMSGDDYLGSIGWCAFDYNTHYDFGSGDRICYHGVMDMYRMPKFASYMYKSQIDPKKEIVVEPLTHWSRGNKTATFPIYVCTNCDAIEVVIEGVSWGVFNRDKTDDNLKGLKYPPILISIPGGEWGAKWNDINFIGIFNNEKVANKKFCSNPTIYDMNVCSDDTILNKGEFDTTRVVVKVVDEEQNLLPYVQGAIQIMSDGIEIIGDKLVPFSGGTAVFWVKTTSFNVNDTAKVIIASSFGIEKEITIQLK